MPRKKVSKAKSAMQQGMEVMPPWFHPPKLIPPDAKHVKLVELGINTKSMWDEVGVPKTRIPKL